MAVVLLALAGPGLCSKPLCYTIYGFYSCGFFDRACQEAEHFEDRGLLVYTKRVYAYGDWKQRLDALNRDHHTRHGTSPYIVRGCYGEPPQFVGGYDQFIHEIRQLKHVETNATRANVALPLFLFLSVLAVNVSL